MLWRHGLLGSLLCAILTLGSSAQETKAPTADSADRDYASELPRIAPTEPKDALATFRVAAGFRVDQVAAEPLVVDPIAVAFDENARMFVVEMRDYSEQAEEHLGRIRLLEDTDGDGSYDQSYVYAEGLSWPTAVACYRGGIFVGAPPHIYYLRDDDGDRRADTKELVFTGFGRSNVQGLLNTFEWGLDNRIHGATSSSGASVIREAGAPKLAVTPPTTAPSTEPLVLRGRDFAIEPRSMTLEPTSGGGQHGMSFSVWGDKFVCSNSDHIQHVRFEDRYVARNPYYAAPGARLSIAVDGPQAEVYRSSPVEPWRIVRTRLRMQKIVPGVVEGGGRAAGYFTGATGVTIYRGDAWPAEFAGWAVVGDVGSNLVHRKRLEEDGATFKAFRFDKESELLASSDIWFRPTQFINGPDGGLYITDMYREVIEHPASLPPVIKRHLDLTSGRDRGRIYRLVPQDFKQPAPLRLGAADTVTLVQTLNHSNSWQRETAARLIYERQDRAAVNPLEKLVTAAERPETRIRALYALDGLQALTAPVVLSGLRDTHPRVREHAVRLGERLANDSAELREQFYALVADPAFRVRYQLALSLGELSSGPRRNQALVTLAKQDGGNHLMQVAVMSSLREGAGEVLTGLAQDVTWSQSTAGRTWFGLLAGQIGKQQRPADVAAVLALVRDAAPQTQEVTRMVVQSLAAPQGSELATQLAAVTGGQAAAWMATLLTQSAATAADNEATEARRIEAILRLRLGELGSRRELFVKLLAPSQPAGVQAAAVATLASYRAPEVADILIEQWAALSPDLRSRSAEVLFSRESWLPLLLTAIEVGKIRASDLDPTRLRLLAEHRDPAIRERAVRLRDLSPTKGRTEILSQYQAALNLVGDAGKGREVFKKACAACHQLEGVGYATGPNLGAMRARGPEAILTNVLDPNREVNPQYVSYAVITNDGRTLTGMITAESATSVTLKRADNASDTVLRIDIEELRSTGQSLMPEGLEKQIDPQAMADLLAYLQKIGENP
jgi:putative membrane-bound dehydrogenase-like protein